LDRILLVTLLEELQIKAPLISEDEPIITYPDTSDISASLAMVELLQVTTSGIGSKDVIEDPTPFPLSIEEEYFDDDPSKAPTYDIKDLKFEPAGQDLEELLASMENFLELSAIINKNWSTTVEEDNSYIRIYPDAKAICYCLQSFSFWTICYDPGQNLQCKGVFPITTTIQGSKMCFEYCHTPVQESGTEASICVPRMFNSHVQ
jgi:hypothetical protein